MSTDREQLFKDAAKAIWIAGCADGDLAWGEKAWAELTMPDDWNHEALEAVEQARAAFAVFEKAHTPSAGEHFHIWSDVPCKPGQCRMEPHTPSDDEREALITRLHAVIETAISDSLTVENDRAVGAADYEALRAERVEAEAVRDAVTAALRRTVQGEPSDALDLDSLEALAKAATPGPWTPYETMQADNFVTAGGGPLTGTVVCGPTYERSNTAFIAAADPQTVLSLIAALRAGVVSVQGEPEGAEVAYFTSLNGCYAEESSTLAQAEHVRREAAGSIPVNERTITKRVTYWVPVQAPEGEEKP